MTQETHGGAPSDVPVHFRHIPEAEKVNFKISETSSLQSAWDQAYRELKIDRNPLDVLQTAGDQPKSLMGSLQLALKTAKDHGVVANYNFEIAAATGGA